MKRFFICILCIAIAGISHGQNLASLEANMSQVATTILKGKTDSARTAANNTFIELMEKALKEKDVYKYPFDSLITISKLSPPDGSFRLFTWNMPCDNGSYKYFGYVLTQTKEGPKFVKLIDRSDDIQNPEGKSLSAKNWYGTHYYAIIETNYKKRKYYTLLGKDFNNRSTTKKIIDVIEIDKNGAVWFGDEIFSYNKKNPKRIIFEYSAQVSMSLKWEAERGMIVFDHLAPPREDLAGQVQYYGPDMSYDGLKFKKGVWYQVDDVDARNPKTLDDNVRYARPPQGLRQDESGVRDAQ